MKVVGIIRSIGERTEDFSKYLLEKQIDDVKLVKNITPLKNSVLTYLNIGLNYDYLVICDADVFVLPGIVDILLKKIIKGNHSIISGWTTSKFFNRRQGGIKIFNGKYIEKMIKYIENTENIRPEESIHLKFNGVLTDVMTSLHEYDQYYYDIYKRFVKQSIKSKRFKHKIKTFTKNNDLDFKVAYRGFFDKEKDFKKSFPNIIEKKPINDSDFDQLKKIYKL